MAKAEKIFINDELGSYTRTQIRRLKKADALEVIEAWFRQRYEDPVHRTPHDSGEGGYQYIYGGPYHARDVIDEQFYDLLPERWIDSVVEELEIEAHEWTETPSDDDYDDRRESFVLGSAAERDLRSHVVKRFDEVAAALADRPPNYGLIGHNNPPNAISAAEEVDLEELGTAISDIRGQLGQDIPSPDAIAPQLEKVTTLHDRLREAAIRKLDLATDEFAKEIGKSLAKLTFWGALLYTLGGAISWLESWLMSLGHS